MKKIFFFTFLILFILPSCKNAATDTTENLLQGEWIWIKSEGGIAGITITPESSKKTKYFEFLEGEIKVFENNKILGMTTYYLENKLFNNSGKKEDFMIFDTKKCQDCNLPSEYQFDFKNKDTLVLQQDNISDGFTDFYIRKTSPIKAATFVGRDPKICASPCCGGLLFNVEGITYQASQLPTGVTFDEKKLNQKVFIQFTLDTKYSCTPQPIMISELKF